MALILKQEANANVTTPPAGSGAVFLNASDQLTVKDSAGNISAIPTFTATNNTAVFFNDAGALGETANLTFVKTTNTLTVLGNVDATGVKTDNLYYANGNPWDLSDPGGSNTQIQFNDDESFGGSANFVWNNSSNTLTVTGTSNVTGTMNVTGNISGGNVDAGNTLTANFVAGTLTTAAQPNITSVGTLSTLTTSGNAIIGGNLVVNGNITYVNVENFSVEDPIISIGGGANGDPLTTNDGKDRGTALQYYTSAPVTAFMGWDNGNGEFAFGSNVSISSDVVTYTTLGNVRASTLLGNVDGSTANFSGNITAANANLGNVVTGNYFTGVLTYAAQPNVTSVGVLTSVQIGATADIANDFPLTVALASQDNSGDGIYAPIGLVGEAVADSANNLQAFGLYGVARANGTAKGTGVQGTALVTNTADTGAAVGVRGYATTTHSGGYNIGVLGNAAGSGVGNYAFYVQNGGIASIETATFWDLTDNSNAALTFNSTGKANIFGIETTDNAEGIFTSGYLNVTGNISAGGIKTNNYYYANGSPVDFQQAGGSNTQVQFNDADGFGGSAAFTFDKTSNLVSMGGALSVTGNANVGNLGTGGLIVATGNVTGGNLVTGGVVAATGNVSGGNLTTSGALSVTGNANVGNIGATNGVFTNVSGNGSALSAITGANVTGEVTFAATANAVAGANVSGEVAFANTANAVAGANVSGQVGNALVAGTVYTNAQPNITSVGTLTSLTVTGNISAGNVSATTFTGALSGAATSATTAGTVTTAAQPNITSVGTLTSVAVTGNATAGNVYANSGTIGASLLTGTLTTAAQPNITSTGTLTSLTVTGTATAGNLSTGGTLSVTGNANVGNLGTVGLITASGNVSGGNLTTGGLVNATGNIVSGANVVTDLIVGKTSGITITATGTNQNINLVPTGNGSINVGNFIISNVATPVASTDAATKQYVDDIAQGLHTHDACQAATPDTLANITTGTITYNNGASGVGANLVTTGTFNLIDGVNVQTSGTRILVKNEANTAHNGIYVWSNATVITRADDFDTSVEMAGGDFTFVTAGTLYDNTGWVMPDPVTTVGTSPVVWTQFSGAGTYTAGTGLTLAGSQFSITNTTVSAGSYGNGDYNATFTVNGQGQLTAAANVALTPNAANLSGTTLNSSVVNSSLTSVGTLTTLNVSGNANVGNIGGAAGVFTTVAGSLTTAAQPNITSVGTLSSLAVTGNISAGNVSATTFTGALSGAATTAGTVTTAAQPNITSVGTLTGLGVNGTITGVNITANTGVFTGNGSSLTALNGSNISTGTIAQARLANSSLTVNGTAISLGGSGTITATATNALTIGTGLGGTSYNGSSAVTITNTGVTSLVAGTNIAVSGATGAVTVSVTGTVPTATTAGTVTTAAQPNITSVGTLTSLTTTTITTGANSTAGSMTGNWTLTAGSRFNATYADLAERYVADMPYEPGTVLTFGGDFEVSITGEADSTRVAGVVSTNPAYLMNSECEGEHVVDLALMGRVPCKVIGPVVKGDLITTSEIAGFGKANNEARAGTIIGKALENFNGPTPDGIIEVLVGRC